MGSEHITICSERSTSPEDCFICFERASRVAAAYTGIEIAQVEAIGFVEAVRAHAEDDFWGGEEACISLTDKFDAMSFQGLSDFSHVEVLFLLHEVAPSEIVTSVRHPRNNQEWPVVGIFAQRARQRPNRIGRTICRVLGVEGTRLFVAELDAIRRTPVLDIKPVMAEFLPRREVRQPPWSRQLMRQCWLFRH